jgi:hypothetical protein
MLHRRQPSTGSFNHHLTYAPDPSSSQLFITYSTADQSRNPDSGRSTSAYTMKIATGAISWMSHLQSIVALSTTETKSTFTVSMGQEMLTHDSLCKNARLRRAIGARGDAGDLLDGAVRSLFVF